MQYKKRYNLNYKRILLICLGIAIGLTISNLLDKWIDNKFSNEKIIKKKSIAPGGFEVSRGVYCI